MRHLLPLMRLFDSAEEISGRTKLQKIVYILQTMGFPFREDYKYHLHGPYSAALTHEVSRLVHLDMLKETHQEIPGAGVNRFTYKATPDLREILAEFEPSVPDGVRGERFDRIVAELNGESSSLLELVATALFLERNGTDPANLEDELGKRKPHLRGAITPALQYLDEQKRKGSFLQ